MSNFREDYNYSLKFLKPISDIVGSFLLEPAALEIDMKEATDMLLLHTKRDVKIACRVRRPGCAQRYKWEFTIRCKRDNGAQTELDKILRGYADWMFYAHASESHEPNFTDWYLIDLDAFRFHRFWNTKTKALHPIEKDNGDGTHFLIFDLRRFPPDPPILVGTNIQKFNGNSLIQSRFQL